MSWTRHRVSFWTILLASVWTALATGARSSSATEITGPRVEWTVSIWGHKRTATAGIERLAELVHKKTGGRFTITLHYGEALSKSRENLDGIAIGAFEIAITCNFYHPQKNPALMVLTLPFLPMSEWSDNRKVRDAVYAHPAVIREFARWDAMLYVSTYVPEVELMGKGDPPRSLQDWNGKTVRAGGGVGKAMRLLGATPTSSTAPEVYTGVHQGTMDAVAMPLVTLTEYKIDQIADWFTGNLAPGTVDCPVVFSKSAFDRLPEQYRTLLMTVKDEVAATQIQAYKLATTAAAKMLEKKLVKVTYTADQLAAFRMTSGRPVIEQWISENQGKFDARGLVELIFNAAGRQYE